MQHFVRAGSLLGFPELVRRYHQNPTELLRSVGFGPSILNDPDLYVPYSGLAQLLEQTAIKCEAPDFGLQLGLRQGLEVLGALGPALCLQRTVADALLIMRKNLDFHARGVFLDTRMDDQWLELSMRFAFDRDFPCEQLSTLSMTLLTRGIEQLHGRADRPVLLGLKIPTPNKTDSYTKGFGCPVLFEQTENVVRYPLEGLSLPIQIGEALREQLGKQWRYTERHATEVELHQQVQRAITALLPTGECSLELVARILSIHPRSLQMHLKKKGLSFGRVLQSTRYRLACEHLRRSDIDMTTLAMNLGYAEQAVFSRAFKKWAGLSPSQWAVRSLQTLPTDNRNAEPGQESNENNWHNFIKRTSHNR
jgi:AraC-like DNA-binding protein